MKLGIDYLGAGGSKEYQRAIIKAHPADFAAGFLLKASGWKSPMPCIRRLLKTGKCQVVRIHALWRDGHDFTERDIAPAVRWAKRVAKLAEDFPDVKIYFSPWLEHRASSALFRKVKRACREVLPKRVKIVCCGNAMPKGINEMHHGGPLPGKYIFSYDGDDIFESDVRRVKDLHKRALYFFGWSPCFNGKRTLTDDTPRERRTCWPTAKDIGRMAEELRK